MKFPVTFSGLTRIISVLVLTCLLYACSAAKLAYNQAPDLAYWYLDDYVDFSGEQSLQVKDDLNKLQAWHRQTQLPGYIDTLQKLQQKMPGDVNAAQTCAVLSDVRRKFVVLAEQTQPAVVAMLDNLRSSQLDVMALKFDKGNATFRSDYPQTARSARQSKRYKGAVSRAETLYGRLDDQQLALVALQVETSNFSSALAYAERQRRQQDTLRTLRALVKTPTTPEQKRQAVRGLYERTLASPNANYAVYAEALNQEACKNFADLHNSTTAVQRRNAVSKLAGYGLDLKTLSAQSDS